MEATLTGQRAPEQVDRLGERGVCRDGVVALAHIAREGVLGLVLAPAHLLPGLLEPGPHGVATGSVGVRVARAPDQQQLALDLTRPRERAGVVVLAELAVVQPCRVPARGGAHARIEPRAEGEVAAGAVARGGKGGSASLQMVERRPHVLVEVLDRRRLGVGLAALL